jgi:branched-chain amino acid transport system permease protein
LRTLRNILYIALALVSFFILDRVLSEAVNPYILQIIIYSGINIIMAVSLNLINGFTGQFSIGHAGFMAIGAYCSAALTFYLGPSILSVSFLPAMVTKWIVFILALLTGGGMAAIAGILVGIPSLRLKGDYLAIVTLGFGEIIRVVILNINAVGGARGFADIPGYTTLFWVLAGATLTVVVIRNLMNSTHGRAFLSVREDEVAAEAMGINTTYYKVTAFVIGAFFAGLAGGLLAHYLLYLHTNSFTFMKSIEIIIMVVLGGMGSITGSIIAAIILTLLPEVLRPVKEYRLVIYSALLVVMMLTRPGGLFGSREFSWKWLKTKFIRKSVPAS